MCRLHYELDLEAMNEIAILIEFSCFGEDEGCQMVMERTL